MYSRTLWHHCMGAGATRHTIKLEVKLPFSLVLSLSLFWFDLDHFQGVKMCVRTSSVCVVWAGRQGGSWFITDRGSGLWACLPVGIGYKQDDVKGIFTKCWNKQKQPVSSSCARKQLSDERPRESENCSNQQSQNQRTTGFVTMGVQSIVQRKQVERKEEGLED